MKRLATGIEKQCTFLDTVLYPEVDAALENVVLFCVDPDTDPEFQHLAYHIFKIRNEYESLLHFERKLVFKAYVYTARKNDDLANDSAVNIDELIKLTQNKDRKILEYIQGLEQTILIEKETVRIFIDLMIKLFEVEKPKLYELLSPISKTKTINSENPQIGSKKNGYVDQN